MHSIENLTTGMFKQLQGVLNVVNILHMYCMSSADRAAVVEFRYAVRSEIFWTFVGGQHESAILQVMDRTSTPTIRT